MRISRSLTIKQMAMVAAVSTVFVLIFCAILFFHFVQQNRLTTATQLESIARAIRQPLSAAILKADIPQAEMILRRMQSAGMVSQADVVLPNQFQALRVRFIAERPVPVMITRIFELPIQISLPIYSLEKPASPQALAYLVLQADPYQASKFIMSTLSTLVTAYFLLVLMLMVAISWCMNRLITRPLRKIARELHGLSPADRPGHQLTLPPLHHDDEMGLLIRSYNRHQQTLQRLRHDPAAPTAGVAQIPLASKAYLMTRLDQIARQRQTSALLVITCETLQNRSQTLTTAQGELPGLPVAEQLGKIISPQMVLAEISGDNFAILATGMNNPQQALELSKQVLTVITEPLPQHDTPLCLSASAGVTFFDGTLNAEQVYEQAFSAALAARGKGKNQLAFFDPQKMFQTTHEG